MTNVTPLHDDDLPPTAIERRIFDDAMIRLCEVAVLPLSVIAAEMVALGITTTERAKLVAAAHFAPGGCPPFDDGTDAQRLCWLIQRHSSSLSTPTLLRLIREKLPAVTVRQIRAELERQADVNLAEADALCARGCVRETGIEKSS